MLYSDEYKRLFEELQAKTCEIENLAYHVSHTGKHYHSSPDKRFMLIGRAMNGWYEDNPIQRICEFKNDPETDWSWLIERSDIPTDGNYRKSWHNGSSFWRTARSICNNLLSLDAYDYLDHIVWSNMFKAAPLSGRNPSSTTCSKQKSICIEILAYEIKTLKPRYVFFCVGEYYVWEFLALPPRWGGVYPPCRNIFDILKIENPLVSYECDSKNVFQVGSINWSDGFVSKIVVAERPETKNEEMYANSVIGAFRK